MAPLDPRLKGYLFTLAGVIVVTPDAVLVRLAAEQNGTFVWIISIKCLILSVMIFAFVLIQQGLQGLVAGVRAGPRLIFAIAFWNAIVTACFPICFQTTTAANALLLISLNPLWAALLGWRVLGDVLPARTVIALVGAALSIALIFVPPAIIHSIADRQHASPSIPSNETVISADGVGNWRGDILSLATGLSLAALITTSRYAAMHKPGIVGAVAMALGGLVAGLVSLIVGLTLDPAAPASFMPAFWPLMVADAGCVGACTILALTFAPRYISPSEVALVLLLENLLGPLWVAIGGYEVPTLWTLVGGILLIVVLGIHQVADMHEVRQSRSRQRAAPEGSDKPDLGAAVEASAGASSKSDHAAAATDVRLEVRVQS